MHFDRAHQCFSNFYSTIPVDVIRIMYYVDSLCRHYVSTSKDFDQQTCPWPWIVAGLVGAFRKGGGWVQASRISLSSPAGIPLSRDVDFAVLAENPSPPPTPSFVFWLSTYFSRGKNTENPVPRSSFTPKPHGNACYAGYLLE